MSVSAQTRLDNAIIDHEQAEAEVERLCDIIERAAEALTIARQAKRRAQKNVDEAAKAVNAARAHNSAVAQPRSQDGVYQGGNVSAASAANGSRNGTHDDVNQSTDDIDSEYSDEGSEEDEDYSDSEESDEDEEEDGFDMGNEALEQVRYRLETAKIDPNSPDGTKLLDELLIRLQNAKEEIIDAQVVNELIDELLHETDGQTNEAETEVNESKLPPPQNPNNPQHPRIRINRGGKVLGWYQGQLDDRGYAREGQGSMYYDAGHECHGTWKDDEMIGRGIYQWSDGHTYDGEWLSGKRHGLGRFIRPDNVVLYGRYEKGHHKGEGIRWSADRREAQMVIDGVPKKTVSLAQAKDIAANLGFDDVLPPV